MALRTVWGRTATPPPESLAIEDVEAQIVAVAEQHAPDGGYGETAYNAETRTVFWVCADWSTDEEHDAVEAAFLAIDGVDAFEHEAEVDIAAYCTEDQGWVILWTSSASSEEAQEAAFGEVVQMAGRPFDVAEEQPEGATEPETGEVSALLREMAASGQLRDSEALLAGLRAVGEAHGASMAAIRDVLYAAGAKETTVAPDVLTMATLGVLERFASRPAPAAPVTHVHVPEREVHVQVEPAQVNPSFTVEAPPAPPPTEISVDVHVPEQPAPQVTVEAATIPAPEVRVEIPAAPAPTVNVNLPSETPRPRSVRVDIDPLTGEKRYIVEDDEPEE